MPLTPLSLQNYDFSNPAQAKQYQYQLMQFLNGLLSQFNTLQGQIGTLNVVPLTSNLGAISGTSTFNCNNSLFVSLALTFSATATLNLTNLPAGAVVMLTVTNTVASAQIFKMTASIPGGTAYTSITALAASSQNLITGWSFGANVTHFMVGMSMTGPALNFVAQ